MLNYFKRNGNFERALNGQACVHALDSGSTPAANGEPQLVAIILIDNSMSMKSNETRANELVLAGHEDLAANALVAARADLAYVTFGHLIEIVRPFGPPQPGENFRICCDGRATFLWKATGEAIKLIESEVDRVRALGNDVFRSLLVVLTDGCSSGEPDQLLDQTKANLQRVQAAKGSQGITVVTFALGDAVDRAAMTDLFGTPPKEVETALELPRFFDWIKDTITRVTSGQGNPEGGFLFMEGGSLG